MKNIFIKKIVKSKNEEVPIFYSLQLIKKYFLNLILNKELNFSNPNWENFDSLKFIEITLKFFFSTFCDPFVLSYTRIGSKIRETRGAGGGYTYT